MFVRGKAHYACTETQIKNIVIWKKTQWTFGNDSECLECSSTAFTRALNRLVKFLTDLSIRSVACYRRSPATLAWATRLNPFARLWFYNATAVRGALWWLRQSHSVNYANHQHSPGATLQTPFSPVSLFHENPFSRSRERLSVFFWRTEKTTPPKKKQKQKKHL